MTVSRDIICVCEPIIAIRSIGTEADIYVLRGGWRSWQRWRPSTPSSQRGSVGQTCVRTQAVDSLLRLVGASTRARRRRSLCHRPNTFRRHSLCHSPNRFCRHGNTFRRYHDRKTFDIPLLLLYGARRTSRRAASFRRGTGRLSQESLTIRSEIKYGTAGARPQSDEDDVESRGCGHAFRR
jgi:hypothetical protein